MTEEGATFHADGRCLWNPTKALTRPTRPVAGITRRAACAVGLFRLDHDLGALMTMGGARNGRAPTFHLGAGHRIDFSFVFARERRRVPSISPRLSINDSQAARYKKTQPSISQGAGMTFSGNSQRPQVLGHRAHG
jgi:hypothetical protein